MKSIEVIVDAEGNVKMEAFGFKGQACEKALKVLQEALGSVKSKTPKPDWYVQEVGKVGVG